MLAEAGRTHGFGPPRCLSWLLEGYFVLL